MSLTITRWLPDTCGCVIHYQWDPSVPVDQRVHTGVAAGGDGVPTCPCAEHASITDPDQLFQTIQAYHQQINPGRAAAALAAQQQQAVADLITNLSAATPDQLTALQTALTAVSAAKSPT